MRARDMRSASFRLVDRLRGVLPLWARWSQLPSSWGFALGCTIAFCGVLLWSQLWAAWGVMQGVRLGLAVAIAVGISWGHRWAARDSSSSSAGGLVSLAAMVCLWPACLQALLDGLTLLPLAVWTSPWTTTVSGALLTCAAAVFPVTVLTRLGLQRGPTGVATIPGFGWGLTVGLFLAALGGTSLFGLQLPAFVALIVVAAWSRWRSQPAETVVAAEPHQAGQRDRLHPLLAGGLILAGLQAETVLQLLAETIPATQSVWLLTAAWGLHMDRTDSVSHVESTGRLATGPE
jgi:hypothetical protein